MNATKSITLKPGQILPNGATILLFSDGGIYDDSIVLCVKPNGEFVTWVINDEGNTSSGHYYPILHSALDDYDKR